MTPRELDLFVEGQQERDEYIIDLLAWVVATTVAPHTKKGRVNPKDVRPKRTAKGILHRERTKMSRRQKTAPRMQLMGVKTGDRAGAEAAVDKFDAMNKKLAQQAAAEAYWSSPEGRDKKRKLGDG